MPATQRPLDSIRDRLALLARCDTQLRGFGAQTHAYELAPPVTEAEVAAFEREHGVALPSDYREFITTLGNGGAGPFYGIVPLRAEPPAFAAIAEGTTPSVGRPFALTEAWRQDATREAGGAPPVAAPASVYDGTVELSTHGCGYFDLLVVHGPRRGEVWADFTQAFGGLVPWYPSFTAAYEAWLDRAFVEWACVTAEALLDPELEDPDTIADAIALVEPLIERAVANLDVAPEDPALREYPQNPSQLVAALAYLRTRAGRTDEALALIDQLPQRAGNDGEAQRLLARARVFAHTEQLELALDTVAAGLACPGLWFATELGLLRHQRTLLRLLERDDEALAVCRRLAELERDDLFAQYDLAWVLLERDEVDEAATVLRSAAERGVGCELDEPLVERIAWVSAGLLEALESAEHPDRAAALRSALGL